MTIRSNNIIPTYSLTAKEGNGYVRSFIGFLKQCLDLFLFFIFGRFLDWKINERRYYFVHVYFSEIQGVLGNTRKRVDIIYFSKNCSNMHIARSYYTEYTMLPYYKSKISSPDTFDWECDLRDKNYSLYQHMYDVIDNFSSQDDER